MLDEIKKYFFIYKYRLFYQAITKKPVYEKGNDYLQTRVRLPRKVIPNIALCCDWIIWDRENIFIDFSISPKLIFVRSDMDALNYFINIVLRKIQNDFVLVTSSHDLPMPGGFQKKYGLDWRTLIDNEYLKVWFTENMDVHHEKIQPIPLGLPHPDLQSWISTSGEGSIWDSAYFDRMNHLRCKSRVNKIFGCWKSRINHSSGTCPEDDNERKQAYEYFIDKSEIFDWHEPEISHQRFMKEMGRYQFVLCPHGGGLDPNPKCWESLIMGAIPIIKRNSMSDALLHLPVVVVDDWSDVTSSNLGRWKKEYSAGLNAPDLEYMMSNSYQVRRMLGYI